MRGRLTAAASSLFILGAATAQSAYAEPEHPPETPIEQELVMDAVAPAAAENAYQIVCSTGPLGIYFGAVEEAETLEDVPYYEYMARYDTGATTTSLHVASYEVKGEIVTVSLPVAEGADPVLIDLPLKDTVKIKRRADEAEAEEEEDGIIYGGHRRPVVLVTALFNGKAYQIEANLTDRGDMKYDGLAGRNLFAEARAAVASCEGPV